MFPSRSSDIGSDLPLIAVQEDYKPGVSTVDSDHLMGGWKEGSSLIIGKQYNLGHTVCDGSLDLDSFTE